VCAPVQTDKSARRCYNLSGCRGGLSREICHAEGNARQMFLANRNRALFSTFVLLVRCVNKKVAIFMKEKMGMIIFEVNFEMCSNKNMKGNGEQLRESSRN
jgi:hypothetical protein